MNVLGKDDGPVPGSAGKAGGAVEVGADGGAVMSVCARELADVV